MNKTSVQDNDSKPLTKPESKRPNQKLYVPKHLRSNNNNNNINTTELNKQIIDDSSIKNNNNNNNENFENIINNLQSLTIESSSSSSTSNNENDNEWENLYDETGNQIINNKTKQIIPSKTTTTNNNDDDNKSNNCIDYLKFEPLELNSSEQEDSTNCCHVIEIYDFPVTFKNENIYNAFNEFIGHKNFDIKWVDDSHCLAVFSNNQEALNALKLNNGFLKTRPISKSGPEVAAKAQRLVNTLKPYKARPQTSSFVATRLIGASLGISISKEKLKVEKTKLDNARTKFKKDKELKEAVWEGQL